MKRITSNKKVSEMGMYELAHNSCVSLNGKAIYRDFNGEIDAREFARKLMVQFGVWDPETEKAMTNDDIFDEKMLDYLSLASINENNFNIEGLIALFYRNIWAMADLRETLKKYEDKVEDGLILDMQQGFYEVNTDEYSVEYKGSHMSIFYDIGKTLFTTEEGAIRGLLKEIAEDFNGKEYNTPQFTRDERSILKYNDFVVVYGESDDLMEFEGAIFDEAGCYNGNRIYFNKAGVKIDHTENCNYIEAVWCDKDRTDSEGNIIPWTYKTDIPHETFMIYEGGKSYCEAIIFWLEDLV